MGRFWLATVALALAGCFSDPGGGSDSDSQGDASSTHADDTRGTTGGTSTSSGTVTSASTTMDATSSPVTSDVTTDATMTTDGTVGPTSDVTTAVPTITETVTDTGDFCPMVESDPECIKCAKLACCNDYLACLMDPGCQCWLECLEDNQGGCLCADLESWAILEDCLNNACDQCTLPGG